MRKRIPSVIALLCVIVYVGAVLSAAFRVYQSVRLQNARARSELEGLASLVSGDSLLKGDGREQVKERIDAGRALEGIIITSSRGNEFDYGRDGGNIINREGENLSFASRFGVVHLPARQVNVEGLRNVNIYAAYSAVNYEQFINILKQTLIMVICALLIAFLTMIIRYTMGGKAPSAAKSGVKDRASAKKAAPKPERTSAAALKSGPLAEEDFSFDGFDDANGAADESADDAAGGVAGETTDDFDFAGFAENSTGEAQTDDFNFEDFTGEPDGEAAEEAGSGAEMPDFEDFSMDLDGSAEGGETAGADSPVDEDLDFTGFAENADGEGQTEETAASADGDFQADEDFDFENFTEEPVDGGLAEETAAGDGDEMPAFDDLFDEVENEADGEKAAGSEELPADEDFDFTDFAEESAGDAVSADGEEAAETTDEDFDFADFAEEPAGDAASENSDEMPAFDDLFDETELADDGTPAGETDGVTADAADEGFDFADFTEEPAAAETAEDSGELPAFDDLFGETAENTADAGETEFAVSLEDDEEEKEEEPSGGDELLPGADIEPEDGYIDIDIPLDRAETPEPADNAKSAEPALPAGIIPEEQIRGRLDSELERCAVLDQDLTVMLMECGENVEFNGELYQKLAEEALEFFDLNDLTFEKGGRGISLIIPDSNLDIESGRAAEFHSWILKNYPGSFKKKTDFRIGLSSRSGRNVPSSRLLFEAANALKKASEGQPIVAFRIDPEKYRQYILSHQRKAG